MSESDYPLPTISPTQVRAYQRCPLSYKHRFVARRRGGQSSAAILGNAVHAAIEVLLKTKRDFGRDLSRVEMESIFDDVWDRERKSVRDNGVAVSQDRQAGREEGYGLLSLYREKVLPQVIPHLVEHRLRFELKDLPVPVVGQVDLIDTNGTVVDHKTTIRPYAEDYLDTDVQMFCYAVGYAFFRLGMRARRGVLLPASAVGAVRVDILVRRPNPVVQQLSKKYSDDDLLELAQVWNRVATKIRDREFPAFWEVERRPNAWRTCAACEHWNHCDRRLDVSRDIDLGESSG